MAGEWIKVRADLFTYPKFLRLAALLWSDEKCRQAEYVAGRDGRDESVTLVTERASHDVTFASLIRVWVAVNAHCKVRGMDAVCRGMVLMDLDPLAGYDGFGDAMASVGLVVEEDGGLTFPNFLEINEPACLRAPAKAGRQRTAEWRERKREGGVTKRDEVRRGVTFCDDREEKRREEKKEENTPPTPKGEKVRRKEWDGTLPPALDVPAFRDAWTIWEAERVARGKRLTDNARKLQWQRCEAWGVEAAVRSIRDSIANQWTGLFPPKGDATPKASRPDRIVEAFGNLFPDEGQG